MMNGLIERLEGGLVPDEELREIIRTQLQKRLQWGSKSTPADQLHFHQNYIKSLKQDGIGSRERDAIEEVLYDIPILFLNIVLGNSLKESASYFVDEATTLEEAVKAANEIYCERSQIRDGDRILDIGCGHGSFMLYVAQKYKDCHITGITNSNAQKVAIEEQSKILKLSNVEVICADATKFDMDSTFDRIVFIESLEYMKDLGTLLKKMSKWLKEDGLLFIDYLCHKSFGHYFEKIDDEDDLFSAYIFPSGITIQAISTLLYFQDDVSVVDHWILSGNHMARTMENMLKNLDSNIDEAREVLEKAFNGKEAASKAITYWRTFFITWFEQFSYNNGNEWMISQILFKNKKC